MPKHTGLISRFNAWMLHKGSESYNERVDDLKQSLFDDLEGEVLEIGPGTGANLKYYPDTITRLIALEPSPFMQNYLLERADMLELKVDVITGAAENIPLPDESVDAVVSTLVLCSVDSLARSLYEVKRVLRPGGRFLFMEHVAAPRNTWRRKVQQGVEPVWRRIADGCHPDRETWKAIKEAGFREVEIERFRLSLPIVGPHIMGRAVK